MNVLPTLSSKNNMIQSSLMMSLMRLSLVRKVASGLRARARALSSVKEKVISTMMVISTASALVEVRENSTVSTLTVEMNGMASVTKAMTVTGMALVKMVISMTLKRAQKCTGRTSQEAKMRWTSSTSTNSTKLEEKHSTRPKSMMPSSMVMLTCQTPFQNLSSSKFSHTGKEQM